MKTDVGAAVRADEGVDIVGVAVETGSRGRIRSLEKKQEIETGVQCINMK